MSPSPPAAQYAGEAAEERTPSSAAPSTPPPGPQISGIYDLFLTAVGLTPRGAAANAFSPGDAEEEDFWSAYEEGQEGGSSGGRAGGELSMSPASARQRSPSVAGTAERAGAGDGDAGRGGGGQSSSPQQLSATADRNSDAGPDPQAGEYGRLGSRPMSASRTQQQQQQQQPSEVDGGRHPGGEAGGQAVDASAGVEPAATTVAGTARRRRLFSRGSGAASESGSRCVAFFVRTGRGGGSFVRAYSCGLAGAPRSIACPPSCGNDLRVENRFA